MGMFDYIWARCPDCGEKLEFQSKGGECLLIDYTLENAPDNVIEDAIGDSAYCKDCKRSWTLRKKQERTIDVYLE